MAIIYPLRPRMTWRRTFSLVGLIWFISVLIAAPAGFYAETRAGAGGRVVCRIQWPEWPAHDTPATAAPAGALPQLPEWELHEAFPALPKPAQRTAAMSTLLPPVAKTRSRSQPRGRRAAAAAAAPTVSSLEGLGGGDMDATDMLRVYCEAQRLLSQGGAGGVGEAGGGAETDRNRIEVAYNLCLLLLNYFVPLSVLLFTYTRVGFVLWRSRVHQPDECHAAIDLEEAHIKAKRKVCSSPSPPQYEYDYEYDMSRAAHTARLVHAQIVKMMIVVVVAFAISWLPFQAFALLHSVLNSAAALPARTAFLLTLAFYWLAMSSSASNPLIYFYMNRRYAYECNASLNNAPLYSNALYTSILYLRF